MAKVSTTRQARIKRPISRRITSMFGLVLLVLGAVGIALPSSAGAAPVPPAISAYALYPAKIVPALIPAGCTTDGPGILTGAVYSSGDQHVSSLDQLNLTAGVSVITLTWTGFAPGCDGAGISLAAKATQVPDFDPRLDQRLVDYSYCGPGGPSCSNGDGGFGPLTLGVPNPQSACNFQIDSIIGPPLLDVGPNGSYYSNDTRVANGKPAGANMLLSAKNGGQVHCVVPPTATATINCATGSGPGAVVTIVNPDLDDTAVVNVLKNGVVVAPNVSVAPFTNLDQFVAFANNETATISVVDTVGGGTILSQSFTANCLNPHATATKDCGLGGVDIVLTNPGATQDAHFTVTVGNKSTDRTVAPDTTDSFTAPVAEGATVLVTITEASNPDTDLVNESFTLDCVNPNASIAHSCSTGGADVTLTNPSAESPAVFTITVDGNQFGPAVTVAPNDSDTVHIPMNEGQTSTIVVTEAKQGEVGSATVTQDCFEPAVTVQNVCQTDGGAALTFTNTGESDVVLSVTKDGTVIDTVTVPAGGTVDKIYPLDEDATATFRVTGPDFDSGDQTITHDCIAPESTTSTPPTVAAADVTRTLPRTGAGTAPLTSAAGFLLLIGGLLVAFANRPMPMAMAGSRPTMRGR